MSTTEKNVDDLVDRRTAAGFVTDIESDTFPPGLSEDVVRAISAKSEPEWMTEWRPEGLSTIGSPWIRQTGRISTSRRLTTRNQLPQRTEET